MDKTLWGGSVMVVTHFMLEGRVVTEVTVGKGMGVAPVIVAAVAVMFVVVTDG